MTSFSDLIEFVETKMVRDLAEFISIRGDIVLRAMSGSGIASRKDAEILASSSRLKMEWRDGDAPEFSSVKLSRLETAPPQPLPVSG